MKLGFNPEKVFLCNKNSFFPVVVMGLFLMYFFSVSESSSSACETIHIMFITTVVLSLLLAGYFRIFSTLASVSVIYAGFFIINNLRRIYGEDFMFSSGYNIWSMLLLPNLAAAYFIFRKEGGHKYWSLFYIFLLLETSIIERLQNQTLAADSYYFYKHIGMFNYPALNLSVLCLLFLLIYYIDKGRILTIASLFASASVFMGIYWADNLFAMELFFFAAVLIELMETVWYLLYIRYKDEELDMENYRQYFHEAKKKFPLKYSITLMYIDEYERLLKRFGKPKMILLKKMFLKRIKEVSPEVLVYNYKHDALILAFKDKNAAECFEMAEDIRRALVKSIFVFNENNHLQLTVSQCVSEKKRSDSDAEAVLIRAEKSLQKACKFTRNITIKA